MLTLKPYKSYYGKRHWSFNLIPAIQIQASTDWSGLNGFKYGSGKPCDVQVSRVFISWLVWSGGFEFRKIECQ